jgi:uncharacterized membrane protein YagU involved in acid resistance
MSNVSTHVPTGSLSVRRISWGIVGGLAGGVGFGILMQLMDIIPMVAMLVGSESPVVGWLVHLAISAFIGASYAVLFGRWATSVGPAVLIGLAYGVFWWVLGALTLMPARLGMDLFAFNTMAWQSLIGHLIYGAILGAVFALLVRRTAH